MRDRQGTHARPASTRRPPSSLGSPGSDWGQPKRWVAQVGRAWQATSLITAAGRLFQVLVVCALAAGDGGRQASTSRSPTSSARRKPEPRRGGLLRSCLYSTDSDVHRGPTTHAHTLSYPTGCLARGEGEPPAGSTTKKPAPYRGATASSYARGRHGRECCSSTAAFDRGARTRGAPKGPAQAV